MLHEKIRSLTQRIHEVITTKLKPQREKSYQDLSSMESHKHDKSSNTGRHVGSESRYKSMRGSSKSRRMMRFKRYKSQYRDHSHEPHNSRGKAVRRQKSSQFCVDVSRPN